MDVTANHYISMVCLLCLVGVANSLPAIRNYDIWGDEQQPNSNYNGVLSQHRDPKVLNFFPVPVEEECLSTDGRRKGVCMNTYECRIQGGKSYGSCALGFGVCCVFTVSCDSEVHNNITYFVNPDFPGLSPNMKSCTLKLRKIDTEISQFRLDFIHFHLGQPNRTTGICEEDVFVMSGGKSKAFTLCGLNSGQHVYYDVEGEHEPVTVRMRFGRRSVSRLWEVRVTQVPFAQRAPAGCLQYHQGRAGSLQTLNFADNGRRLANQDYSICVRQELGMCSIAYEPCDENSFRIGSAAAGPQPQRPQEQQEEGEEGSGGGAPAGRAACSDRIVMPCDSDDLIMPGMSAAGPCDVVRCGGSFCPGGEPTCRVESAVTPFTIGVQFGPGARHESPEDNLGMCLNYEQLPCV